MTQDTPLKLNSTQVKQNIETNSMLRFSRGSHPAVTQLHDLFGDLLFF